MDRNKACLLFYVCFNGLNESRAPWLAICGLRNLVGYCVTGSACPQRVWCISMCVVCVCVCVFTWYVAVPVIYSALSLSLSCVNQKNAPSHLAFVCGVVFGVILVNFCSVLCVLCVANDSRGVDLLVCGFYEACLLFRVIGWVLMLVGFRLTEYLP